MLSLSLIFEAVAVSLSIRLRMGRKEALQKVGTLVRVYLEVKYHVKDALACAQKKRCKRTVHVTRTMRVTSG